MCFCVYLGHFLCVYVDAYFFFFLKPNLITMSYWKLKQINRAMCLHSKVLESGELLRCLSSGWGGVSRITVRQELYLQGEITLTPQTCLNLKTQTKGQISF